MTIRHAAALVAAFFSLVACAATPAAEPPPSPRIGSATAGLALAERLCVSCHAIGAKGDSPLPEAPAFRRLAERYPVGMLEEAFAEGILVGHPAMPEFEFEQSDIDNLLAYLESIQERRGG